MLVQMAPLNHMFWDENAMSVDKFTVSRIAQLARINVSEQDLDVLADELSKIVGWVEQLDEVNTEGVPPMSSTVENIVLRQRDDVVTDGDCKSDILKNASQTDKGYFVMPKVIE